MTLSEPQQRGRAKCRAGQGGTRDGAHVDLELVPVGEVRVAEEAHALRHAVVPASPSDGSQGQREQGRVAGGPHPAMKEDCQGTTVLTLYF